jgi:hypothetical protein
MKLFAFKTVEFFTTSKTYLNRVTVSLPFLVVGISAQALSSHALSHQEP